MQEGVKIALFNQPVFRLYKNSKIKIILKPEFDGVFLANPLTLLHQGPVEDSCRRSELSNISLQLSIRYVTHF